MWPRFERPECDGNYDQDLKEHNVMAFVINIWKSSMGRQLWPIFERTEYDGICDQYLKIQYVTATMTDIWKNRMWRHLWPIYERPEFDGNYDQYLKEQNVTAFVTACVTNIWKTSMWRHLWPIFSEMLTCVVFLCFWFRVEGQTLDNPRGRKFFYLLTPIPFAKAMVTPLNMVPICFLWLSILFLNATTVLIKRIHGEILLIHNPFWYVVVNNSYFFISGMIIKHVLVIYFKVLYVC